MTRIFTNRREAGQKLAQKLTAYANNPQAIVLGLPRGGVPVAYEIAKTLNLPLDVCLVKKLGLPNHPEIAMGAIAEDELLPDYCGNITIINKNTAHLHEVNSEQIQAIAARAKVELRWRDCEASRPKGYVMPLSRYPKVSRQAGSRWYAKHKGIVVIEAIVPC